MSHKLVSLYIGDGEYYTRTDADAVIAELKADYKEACDRLQTANLIKDEQKKKRSLCLKLMQKLGIDTTDWTRINAFCQDQRISGKVFGRLTIEELDALAEKLRAIQRKGGLKQKKEVQPTGEITYFIPIGGNPHLC